MASFNFTVDTSPMASEMQSVSRGVNRVSGAVVEMQSAVISAERESASMVCQNVNKGFYALMHSQISQKIAQFTSTVEAKLLELGQHAAALKSIQHRMNKDYNMISGRYTKVFNSLNNNLQGRVAEIDMPVFKLVDRDVKLLDSRIGLNSAKFAVNQLESILSSQLISVSKVKRDADFALMQITRYLKDNRNQTQKSQGSMQDLKIDSVEDIYIPVSIVESVSAAGSHIVEYYVARSGNPDIDKSIDSSVCEQSVNTALRGSWIDMDNTVFDRISAEFNKLLENFEGDERTKDEIQKMFSLSENVQQLKPESHE